MPEPSAQMNPPESGDDLGILARRKIEAAVIAPIYDEMRKAFGEERARDVLRRAIRRAAIAAGAEMAAKAPAGADLESFKSILPLWMKGDALTIEVVADRPGAFDFNVTRCRYAETYRAMGLGEIGDLLSCNRDGAFCEGFDPRITLTRTQTIMGGASHCDFRYRVREAKAKPEPEGARAERAVAKTSYSHVRSALSAACRAQGRTRRGSCVVRCWGFRSHWSWPRPSHRWPNASKPA